VNTMRETYSLAAGSAFLAALKEMGR
jgi:hypothetical protein